MTDLEEIPEDVRKAAIAALDAQRNASGWSFLSTHEERIEVLSRAILAERERCAMVAETAPPTRYADRPGYVDVPADGKEIAELIRCPAA